MVEKQKKAAESITKAVERSGKLWQAVKKQRKSVGSSLKAEESSGKQ